MTSESVVEDNRGSSHFRRSQKVLIATIATLVVLVIKGAWIALSRGPAELVLDAAEYWRLSESVIDGDIWLLEEPIAYRTPGYPWFLAFMRFLFGDSARQGVILTQLGIHIGSTVLMGILVTRMLRRAWVLPMTIAFAIPATSAFVMDTSVLTEPLFVFAMAVHLAFVWKFAERPCFSMAIAAGGSLGLLCLVRPIAMYMWPVHALLILPHFRCKALGITQTLKLVSASLLVFVGTLSPWMARNHSVFGAAFLTQFTGRNLWIPTFQDGSGAFLSYPESESARELTGFVADSNRGLFDDEDWRHTWTVSHALRDAGVPDDKLDRLMKEVAVDAIVSNPKPALYKTIRRSVNFWRTPVTHLPVPDSPVEESLAKRWVDARLSRFVGFNSVVLIVTVVSTLVLVQHRDSRCAALWLACIMLYFNAVTAILEIPDYRYRMILEPMQMALVAGALCVLCERFSGWAVSRES